MTERNEEAREMVIKVEERLDKGALDQAKRAFTQNWRESVPDLPIRFSAILIKIDRKAVSEVLRLRQKNKGKNPQLVLDWAGDSVQVRMARGRKLALGFLPRDDSELLKEMGSKARKYRPQLLEVKRNEDNEIAYVAVELVRPELKICSSCGNEHTGEHANCEKCRSRRKRIGKEQFEHAPVPFQEALEQIVAEEGENTSDLEL